MLIALGGKTLFKLVYSRFHAEFPLSTFKQPSEHPQQNAVLASEESLIGFNQDSDMVRYAFWTHDSDRWGLGLGETQCTGQPQHEIGYLGDQRWRETGKEVFSRSKMNRTWRWIRRWGEIKSKNIQISSLSDSVDVVTYEREFGLTF